MKNLTKTLIASAIVAGAIFAGPVAANAVPYTPSGSNNVSTTTGPGSPFSLPFGNGTFAPNSPLTVKYTSAGPVPTAVFVAATSGPFSAGTSNAQGAATVTGTVPTSATSQITATVTDATGTSVTGTINVGGAAGAGSNLATTGTYISIATIWGAVGLLALGGGLIAVRVAVRRKDGSAAAHAA